MEPNKSRPALRTYSKRVLQDSYKPPGKRQRIEILETAEDLIEIKDPHSTQNAPKKRSISEYFKSEKLPENLSNSQPSIFSSDPVKEQLESPNSSPPALKVSTSVVAQKARARRRLTTRPPLRPLELKDQNSDIVKSKRRSNGSTTPSFVVRSPPRTSFIAPLSHTGPSSEESSCYSGAEDTIESGPIAMDSRRTVSESHEAPPTPSRPGRSGIFRSVSNRVTTRVRNYIGNKNEADDKNETNDTALGPQVTVDPVNVPAAAGTRETTSAPMLNSRSDARLPQSKSGIGSESQSILNFGSKTRTSCDTCHLEYNLLDEEEKAFHKARHDDKRHGLAVSRSLHTQISERVRRIWSGSGDLGEDFIVAVDYTATRGWKDMVQEVLRDYVDKDLGSTTMTAKRLWSLVPDPLGNKTNGVVNRVARYKVYLYLRAYKTEVLRRVVSVVVTEGITKGIEVEMHQQTRNSFAKLPADAANEIPVFLDKSHEAVLGVNKIWTHENYRGRHLATKLLDKVRRNHFYSHTIPRIHVAWTPTTELGMKFAKKYMDGQTKYAFLVYHEAN